MNRTRLEDYARNRMNRERMNRDGRNPYGSQGGYVVSRNMDSRLPPSYDYESGSDYDSRGYNRAYRQSMDSGMDSHYGRNIGYSGFYGNVPFGVKSMEEYPYDDYADYNDYGDYSDYDDYNDYGDYRRTRRRNNDYYSYSTRWAFPSSPSATETGLWPTSTPRSTPKSCCT